MILLIVGYTVVVVGIWILFIVVNVWGMRCLVSVALLGYVVGCPDDSKGTIIPKARIYAYVAQCALCVPICYYPFVKP